MGFDEGRIIFNSDTGVYYTGQTVFGKLIFDQGKNKTFRNIYVKINGFCLVHWRTSHTRTVNGKQETYYVDHTSREEYVNQKTYLIGSEHSEQTISPGHYEFPFQCMIPPNCPSSYEGSNGHIRYEVKVVVNRAFKPDQEKKAVLRVIAPLDLNTVPNVKDPIQIKFDDTYYCCCSRAGSVSTVVKIPYGGFVPGQVIPIEVGCENASSVTIDSITFTLKKDTKFHAQGTRSDSEDVARLELGEVRAHTNRNFTAELPVPHVDTPNVRTCQYIDVEHRLKVTLSPDGCHSDSSQSRQIVIGTIPLVGSNYPENVQDHLAQHNIPVINQPLPSPFLGSRALYPEQNSPHPVTTPPYPGASPYPSHTPYPGAAITPYPTSPYPSGNPQSQYPPPYSEVVSGNAPYPGQKPTPFPNSPSEKAPYPGGPTVTPYPSSNSPYPSMNSPYPTSNIPQPSSNSPNPTSPFPPTSFGNTQSSGPNVAGLRTGTFGFIAQAGDNKTAMPQLPIGATVPYPISPSSNPYADASAPQPTSPDDVEIDSK